MQPAPIQRPASPFRAVMHAAFVYPMPATMDADIFERIEPTQSTRCGAGLLNACGISVPRDGLLDNLLCDVRDGCIFGVVFAVPVALIGLTFPQICAFSFAFFFVLNCFR